MKTKVSTWYFLWWKPSKKINKSSEQGLTLLESLVGILLITLVLAASTPPILLSAETRIQNRRSQQAMQIAQREVDRVRLIMEQENSRNDDLPLEVSTITNPDNINNVDPPSSICTTCDPYASYPYISFTQVVKDGDFLIQVFREPGIKESNLSSTIPPTDPTPNDAEDKVMAFRLGVRVYSLAAQQNLSSLQKEPASLVMTNTFGQQTTRPLAVLYADMARSDLTLSLAAYRKFAR